MVVCKFFLQGECKFGENCRFDHQIPTENISASGNLQPFQSSQNQVFVAKSADAVDTNTLITSVHNDMVSVEESGQWLLTCYAPFKEKALFPGFEDQSFEEVRLGFYEAQKRNTSEHYKQQLQQALVNAKTKFKALQTPTKEIVEILRNIYNTQLIPPADTSSNQNSVFGNKIIPGLPAITVFGQNGSQVSLFGSMVPFVPKYLSNARKVHNGEGYMFYSPYSFEETRFYFFESCRIFERVQNCRQTENGSYQNPFEVEKNNSSQMISKAVTSGPFSAKASYFVQNQLTTDELESPFSEICSRNSLRTGKLIPKNEIESNWLLKYALDNMTQIRKEHDRLSLSVQLLKNENRVFREEIYRLKSNKR